MQFKFHIDEKNVVNVRVNNIKLRYTLKKHMWIQLIANKVLFITLKFIHLNMIFNCEV